MALTWRKSLETGVVWQDNQHKELFNRINGLLDAMSHNKGQEEVGNLIEFLDRYVIFHFSEEEKMMKKHNYQWQAFHKGQHDRFKEDLAEIKNRIKDGVELVHVIDIQDKVVVWLLNHIGKTDQQLGEFLKTRRNDGEK